MLEADLTHDLLLYLRNEGYNFLLAKEQLHIDNWGFTPIKADIKEYILNSERDIAITIEELLAMPFETHLNHKVIF